MVHSPDHETFFPFIGAMQMKRVVTNERDQDAGETVYRYHFFRAKY